MRLNAKGVADFRYRVADGCFVIAELSAAASTEMASMCMNAEPVFVEVFKSAERALNVLNLESKQRRSHIIDGIEFRDYKFSFDILGRGRNSASRI